MSSDNISWFHKHPIAVYLILANGITWLCWLPGIVIGSQQGYILPNYDTYTTIFRTGFANTQHLLISIVFLLGVYGPLIAALVATWLDGGRGGLIELGKRIIKWRVGVRWYFTILIIAFLLAAIPFGIAVLTGMTGVSAASAISLPAIIILFFAQILTSGVGEEPGWRGFLLPRLKVRFGGQKYIWLLGLIWAIWHYPFTIYLTLSMMQNVTPAQMIVNILVQLAGLTISLIGMTFLYVWVYNYTQSVFLAILLHALTNIVPLFVLSFLADPQVLTMFIGIMPWVLVFALQKTLGKKRFPDQIASI
jgi:membrane protease YdiL (CAAX protease family)